MTTLNQAATEIAKLNYPNPHFTEAFRMSLEVAIATNPTLLAMEKELAELRKDKEVVDWLDTGSNFRDFWHSVKTPHGSKDSISLRTAVRAATTKENQGKQSP